MTEQQMRELRRLRDSDVIRLVDALVVMDVELPEWLRPEPATTARILSLCAMASSRRLSTTITTR